jgi:hypothetical protein
VEKGRIDARSGPVRSGGGFRHLLDLRPDLVLPAGVTGGGEHDLAVLGDDEARRRVATRLAFLAEQEVAQDRPSGLGPVGFLQDAGPIGRIDDVVVKLGELRRRLEAGFGLGTPDLAAPSKLVADEDDRELALRTGEAGQRRGCSY